MTNLTNDNKARKIRIKDLNIPAADDAIDIVKADCEMYFADLDSGKYDLTEMLHSSRNKEILQLVLDDVANRQNCTLSEQGERLFLFKREE